MYPASSNPKALIECRVKALAKLVETTIERVDQSEPGSAAERFHQEQFDHQLSSLIEAKYALERV